MRGLEITPSSSDLALEYYLLALNGIYNNHFIEAIDFINKCNSHFIQK